MARKTSRSATIEANAKSPAPSVTPRWMATSGTGRKKGTGSLATINTGCRKLDKPVIASAEPTATMAMARSLALTMTARGIGRTPRIAVSRGSTDSASQAATATSAIAIIEIELKKNR